MRYVGCCWLLAMLSIAHGVSGQVSLVTEHFGLPRVGFGEPNSVESLSHPTSIIDYIAAPYGTLSATVERGRARIFTFVKSDATWARSGISGTARMTETIVADVPCRPELLGTQGRLRVRTPTITWSGLTDGKYLASVAACSVQVVINNSTEVYYRQLVSKTGLPDTPPDISPQTPVLDAMIVFGQPIQVSVVVLAGTTTGSQDPILTYSTASIDIVWEGVEGVYDSEGLEIPCVTGDTRNPFINPFVPPPACPGDTNNDGHTDAADLSVLLASFGTMTAPYSGANFNSDVFVNGADLSILLGNFGCDVTP